jgi:predicted ribosome quality control (RQC) complex YloA/Tae2 family protein
VSSKGRPYKTVVHEGFRILIGRSDADNDRLTFDVAEPDDVWLHVAGFGGSHVVVCNPDRLPELPPPVLQRAAELAAWHSKGRGARGKVEVHWCRAGDVRKPHGWPAGKVLLKEWDAIRVYPRGVEPPAAGL